MSSLKGVLRWAIPIGALGLFLAVCRSIPWPQVRAILGQANLGWLSAGVGIAALAVTMRSLRLKLLLGPSFKFTWVWRGVALGYFGGLVLPLGGGEAVKIASLQRQSSAPLGQIAATVGLDRMVDLIALLALACSAASAHLLPGHLSRVLPLLALLVGAGISALAISILLIRRLSADWAVSSTRGSPPRWLESLIPILTLASSLRPPGPWPWILLIEGLILLCDWGSTAIALHAFPFGANLPAGAALQVCMAIMLAFAIPLVPGGLGAHQAACLLALTPYGVPPQEALAFSLAAQVGHVLLVTTLGASTFATGRLRATPTHSPERP